VAFAEGHATFAPPGTSVTPKGPGRPESTRRMPQAASVR